MKVLLLVVLAISVGSHFAYGENDFEKYYAAKGGVLDDDFSKLINDFATFNDKLPSTEATPFLAFPQGRSPEKKYTSFANPRKVASIPRLNTDGSNLSPRTFMAYTAGLKQYEIISWNPQTKKYDFMLRKTLANGKSVLETPAREECISCHQNEGPHLSRFPWSETPTVNAPLDRKLNALEISEATSSSDKFPKEYSEHILPIIEESLEKRGSVDLKVKIDEFDSLVTQLDQHGDDFAAIPHDESRSAKVETKFRELAQKTKLTGSEIDFIVNKAAEKDWKKLTSEDLRSATKSFRDSLQDLQFNNGNLRNIRGSLSAFSLDAQVRAAAARPQLAAICQNLCRGDRACLRHLLFAAVAKSPNQGTDAIFEKANKSFFQATHSFWPTTNFRRPSSVLPDKNPLASPEQQGSLFVVKDTNEFVSEQSGVDAAIKASRSGVSFAGQVLNAQLTGDLSGTNGAHYLEQNTVNDLVGSNGLRHISVAGSNKFLDPATPRASVGGIPNEYAMEILSGGSFGETCFDFNQTDIDALHKIEPSAAYEAIVKNHALDDILDGPWPPKKEAIFKKYNAAIQKIQDDDLNSLYCNLPDQRGAITLLGKDGPVKKPAMDQDLTLKFTQYCATCHGPKSSMVLPLCDLKSLKKYKDGYGRSVQDILKAKEMPPATSKNPLSEEQRQQLIEHLSAPDAKP